MWIHFEFWRAVAVIVRFEITVEPGVPMDDSMVSILQEAITDNTLKLVGAHSVVTTERIEKESTPPLGASFGLSLLFWGLFTVALAGLSCLAARWFGK